MLFTKIEICGYKNISIQQRPERHRRHYDSSGRRERGHAPCAAASTGSREAQNLKGTLIDNRL